MKSCFPTGLSNEIRKRREKIFIRYLKEIIRRKFTFFEREDNQVWSLITSKFSVIKFVYRTSTCCRPIRHEVDSV